MRFLFLATLISFASPAAPAACLSPDELRAEVENFKSLMHPVMESLPMPVEISYQASQGNIGAFAYLDHGTAKIHISGTQCRDLIHADEFKLLLCHELGHLAGGAPYEISPDIPPRSSEGQADYYATAQCLPTLIQDPRRIVAAAFNFATFTHPSEATGASPGVGDNPRPSLEHNDSSVVQETLYNGYPSSQCRLDTFLAGLTHQPRPRCWFKN